MAPNHKINPVSSLIDLSDTTEYLKVNREDLNLYFAGTYLYFTDRQKWEYLAETGLDEEVPEIVLHTSNRNILLKDASIQFQFPKIGFYNFRKGVLQFRRKTERQNKKGLCASNAEFVNVLQWYDKLIEIPYSFAITQQWKWHPNYLNLVFVTQKYPEYREAFSKVSRLQDFAKAVNHDFFIGQGIQSKYPSLWFHKTLIGRCVSKTQIVIDNLPFLQEALDCFLPQGIEIDTETTLT